MKHFIHSFYVRDIRNNLHFEFFRSILKVLQTIGDAIIHIMVLVKQLEDLLIEEERALIICRRYEATEPISENDRGRDSAFYRAHEFIRSNLRHFDPVKKEAAQRLDAIFRDFAKTPELPLPEESANIHHLLQRLDLQQNDIDTLGLSEWIDRLRQCNEKVRSLMAERDSEAAVRAQLRTKSVRLEVDKTWGEIIDRLESAATLEGAGEYETLFGEINARVNEYKTLLMKEEGRRKKKNNTDTDINPLNNKQDE
jgi:hypothetical protein